MTRFSRRKASAGVLGLAVLAALAVAAPAGAAPAAPAAAPLASRSTAAVATTADVAGAGATATASAAAAYWTSERMRRALPAEPPATTTAAESPGAASAIPPGARGSTHPAPAPAAAATAARELLSGASTVSVSASPTVGKVFFRDPTDGQDYVCSGGALNSASKRLVITAGHCVHGGAGGQYMQNWIFVPYYDHGAQPYGAFSARTYRTFDSWRNSSSRHHDIAMVTTHTNASGQLLVNRVGGNGLSWNYSRSIFLTILAYPADPPYDGDWQHYCQGTTRRVSASDGRIELQCGFTGGSSGGPWLRAYSNTTRLGYVNGTMSTLTSTGWNRSSYFDTKVKTMYDNTVAD